MCECVCMWGCVTYFNELAAFHTTRTLWIQTQHISTVLTRYFPGSGPNQIVANTKEEGYGPSLCIQTREGYWTDEKGAGLENYDL